MSSGWQMLKMKTWIPVVIALFAVVAIACGAESSSAPVAAGADASESAGNSAAPTQGDTAVPSQPETASGGLDEACVQRVLGRAAGGFSDVTAAERDAIFQQCSGSEEQQLTRQFAGGRGGDLLEAINTECLAGITGSEDFNLGDLTLEDRQRVFTECLPEDFARGPGGPGGFGGPDGGFGGRIGGAFASLTDLLEGCVTDALGETPENLFGLEPEQFDAIAEACGDELPEGFGDFQVLGGDGAGGFGGFRARGGADGASRGGIAGSTDGGGGFPGGGGRGGFRSIDFSSTCVADAVGHAVEGPQDLTPEDFQKILENCA